MYNAPEVSLDKFTPGPRKPGQSKPAVGLRVRIRVGVGLELWLELGFGLG